MRITGTMIALPFLLLVLSSCSGATDPIASKGKLKLLMLFPHLGKSHFDVLQPLLVELARRGHELTVISHFPRTEKAIAAEPLPNYKDIDLRDSKYGVFVNVVDLHWITDSYTRLFKELYQLYSMGSIACNIGLRNPEVKRLASSGEKFDAILVESFNTNCFMALVHKLDAPFVQLSTHQLMPWAIDDLGLSHEASYIPAMLTRQPRPMNFLQRTMNVVTASMASMIYNTVFSWRDQSIANEIYGPGLPNLKTVTGNASLMMVNTHYTLHGSISFPANVIEIGGVHVSPKVKPLPKDLARFLDEAHEGVLYFNLGSMVKMATMPKDKLSLFVKVLGSIPRKVVWKWEVDDIPNLPRNVLIQKWLPQYDVLNHPNVKCYFGHGGLLGLTEGVQSGVPMILMPLYGDQYQNAIAAQARGVALVLSFTELDEQTLRHALDEVFNNTRYQENSKKLAKAFKDRPASPLETAAWWIEYVGRGHGRPYLKSEGANMPWCQRNLVDVAAFLTILFLLFLYGSYRALKCILAARKSGQEAKKRGTSKKRD